MIKRLRQKYRLKSMVHIYKWKMIERRQQNDPFESYIERSFFSEWITSQFQTKRKLKTVVLETSSIQNKNTSAILW